MQKTLPVDYKELCKIAKDLGIRYVGKGQKQLAKEIQAKQAELEASAQTQSGESGSESPTEAQAQATEGEGQEAPQQNEADNWEPEKPIYQEAEERREEELAKQVAEMEAKAKEQGKSAGASKPRNKEYTLTPELEAQVKLIIENQQSSKAEKIRNLLVLGLERSHVAKLMDVRYQQVFQVEKQMKEKQEKEAVKAQQATEQPAASEETKQEAEEQSEASEQANE